MKPCDQRTCPYFGRVQVPYSGDPQSDVLIVGESPGAQEEQEGKPFIGKSGTVLKALLASIGKDRNSVMIANSCRCRIDKDNDSIRQINEALRHCRKFLDGIIKIQKPKVIVSLGAYALQQLVNKKKILDNRGRVFTSEWGVPVLCTVHPAYILRGAQAGFPDIPFQKMSPKEKMIFSDFAMVNGIVIDGIKGAAIDITGYHFAGEKDIAALAKAETVAFDFETTGLDVFDPAIRLLTIGVSVKEGHGAVWEFVKGRRLAGNTIIGGLQRLTPPVRAALMNPKVHKVVASRSFEEKWLRQRLGVEMRGPVHDVLVMAHVVNENSPSYSLETLAGIYTDLKRIKDVVGGTEQRKNLANVDRETLMKYNAVDADATMRLFNTLWKHIEADPKLAVYYAKFILPVQNMLAETYCNGCKIDTKTLQSSEAELSRMIDTLEQECLDMLPPKIRRKHQGHLDLTRRHLIIDTLFGREGFKLKPKREFLTPKTGEPKVGKDHLQQFDHPFIEKYLRYGTALKFRSTHIVKLWSLMKKDGRVYPDTLLNRTVTGRTVIVDPHIQVIPTRSEMAKLIKECFVADRGWEFITRDLSQSEIRIAGWISGDPNILGALRAGIDIHTKTACIVNKISLEKFLALPEKERKGLRQKAKAVNFGFLYGMGAFKFQRYAKTEYGIDLSMQQCEEIRAAFFARPNGYYRLPHYHEQQRRLAHKDGLVRSILGRVRHLPEVYSQEREHVGGAERQAINFPIQSFSSDLGLLGMVLFQQEVRTNRKLRDKVRVMWFIHDAIYGQSRLGVTPLAMRLLKECMEERTKEYIRKWWGVEVGYPIASDGKTGPSWGALKDFKEVA